MLRQSLILCLFCAIAIFFLMGSSCSSGLNGPKEVSFLNHNDTVDYVGMQTCRSCHVGHYETFMHTGMGASFENATPEKSAAEFGEHQIVFDSSSNFFYKPFFKKDTLYVHEFRLENGDTTHSRTEAISYVVGSGQHTNSHICNFNGYLYQAPITFYTQKGEWDMAPGFADGFNSRFSRTIGQECMTCHNGLPEKDAEALNKFVSVKQGIDCERCHGPGELHVKEKLAGNFTDTSKGHDATIVNPGRLPKDQQMDVCLRCHLQGLALLEQDKKWEDFKPGLRLADYMQVFLPRYSGSESEFIMASQADRLMMSKCYVSSDMTCISCHNPHVTVDEMPDEYWTVSCKKCHEDEDDCTAALTLRSEKDDDCVQCHMPSSDAIDIPHVYITDHYIRIADTDQSNYLSPEEADEIRTFLGLDCITCREEKAEPLLMVQAYLQFYEKFNQQSYLLDSAKQILLDLNANDPAVFVAYTHLYYLTGQWVKLATYASDKQAPEINDSWTAYRIGESYLRTSKLDIALNWFDRAVTLQPKELDFLLKQGSTLALMNRLEEAEEVFMNMCELNPRYASAWTNLSYLSMRKGDMTNAEEQVNIALDLDPDDLQALFNYLAILVNTNRELQAEEILQRILIIDPDNPKALQISAQFSAASR